MKTAAKEKFLWPLVAALALLLALAAALPAAASIPRELPSRLTETSPPDVPTPPPETASEPNRFALYELAVWADGAWRLPPRAAVAGAYAKTRVWGLESLCSAQSQENTGLKAEIAEGVCDGPSQYIFAGWDPVNMGDPLGLCKDPADGSWGPGRVRVCIDTFISTRFVGGVLSKLSGALGDNRSFEAEGEGSFRTRVGLIFDPESGRIDFTTSDAESDVLFGLWGRDGATLIRAETGSREGLLTPSITLDHSGLNGFWGFPMAPSDDITYRLEFRFLDNGTVEARGVHDGYPSYEIWVYRDGVPPEQLYIFRETNIKKIAETAEVPVSVRSSPFVGKSALGEKRGQKK